MIGWLVNGIDEWDGAKAVLKNKQIQNLRQRLQNAADVVDFLCEALSTRVPSSYVTRNPDMPRKPKIFREFCHVPVNATIRRNR